ncbi:MAG: serine/threonine-protein kinase [Coleofasciculaceae cyanobacterium]
MLQAEQILNERYQLKQKLGKNAMRQTWLAEDIGVSPPEKVVVKLLAFGGEVQWDDLRLFEREAQILKQLDHPRIPRYRDYFHVDDSSLWFGLVHEYIPGLSLKEHLSSKRFSERQVRQIALEVLKILEYLHQLNPAVLHRDIKPSNLIWGEDEHVYLVDFGAVQERAAQEGTTFTVVGTYGYAPMEQFGGKTVPASDLYGLGATLIHLLTGTAPAELPQRNLRICFQERISITPNLVSWIEKLTEPAPEERFKTAVEARLALESGRLNDNNTTASQLIRPTPVAFVNNSGQGGLFNSSVPVPDEIKGWNWGAFLMPWFWALTNNVWVGLLAFVPQIGWIIAIALGVRGNELAWKSRKWRSLEQFKAHQRGWAIAGTLLGVPLSLMLWAAFFAMIF